MVHIIFFPKFRSACCFRYSIALTGFTNLHECQDFVLDLLIRYELYIISDQCVIYGEVSKIFSLDLPGFFRSSCESFANEVRFIHDWDFQLLTFPQLGCSQSWYECPAHLAVIRRVTSSHLDVQRAGSNPPTAGRFSPLGSPPLVVVMSMKRN